MGIQKQNHQVEQSMAHLTTKLYSVLDILHKKGDEKGACKVAELFQKADTKELTIAFCGHFSAGKSSLINEILEERILPASPIPTSANVVKIKKGQELAHVNFFKGESLEITPPVSFELVKAYCKDGDHVETVEYQYPFEHLPEDIIVLDTPGVDSTDDAHRISTESSLHLADVIFYVMDYNHVQSEVNLKFIKELQEKEKKIYLIINQIDKHREEELLFSTYTKRLQDSFDDWGLIPASIYFTSLKDKQHHLNDLQIVKETIHILRKDKLEILPKTIERALEHILLEHKEWILEQKEAEITKNERIVEAWDGPLDEVSANLDEKRSQISTIEFRMVQAKEAFLLEIKRIVENANITPFEMRELAEKFLESRQKGYKVGFLFSSKKTEEEKIQRSEALCNDLKSRVQTQIEKFIHENILTFLKDHDFHSSTSVDEVQEISLSITNDFVLNHVKQGAGYSGNAVLNYSKDLAQSIKLAYQKQVQSFMEKYFDKLDRQSEQDISILKIEESELQEVLQAQKNISSLYLDLEKEYQLVVDVMKKINSADISELSSKLVSLYTTFNYKRVHGDELEITTKSTFEEEKVPVNNKQMQLQKGAAELVGELQHTASLLKGFSGFQTVVKDLKDRAEKINNQSFTVSLFGAFSAGKSSLANALFGEMVLPVSPNPTTASINKISPVTEASPHGTVHVMMKSPEQILDDVNQALGIFRKTATSLETATKVIAEIIRKNEHVDLDSSKKPQFQFLKAYLAGFGEMRNHLGSLHKVTFIEFEAYVAQEEKSCFVEWIEVFYDCPFTRQGLTLVDTPGADSINSRHTDVSFDFIKNADAILFVTYYQHAFSKADREFLIQLGRVKDAFAMDKMFFLVNAADLANNEEELELVCNYVKEQLTNYGIRHPRLYPVSSLLALKEKQGETTAHPFLNGAYLHEFEHAFSEFIQSDLVEMRLHAAQSDINRAVDLFKHYVTQARLGADERESLKQGIANNKQQILTTLHTYSEQSFTILLEKEIQELLYYVKQRTLLRFSDFFKESFNPAVLREDGRNIREQLRQCLQELSNDVFHNLSQEIRATTVRIENFLVRMLREWQQEIENEVKSIEANSSIRKMDIETINPYKIVVAPPEVANKTHKQTAGYYRNSKSFFEKNEKQHMFMYLEEQFSPMMDIYLKENLDRLTVHYQLELTQSFQEVHSYTEKQIQDFFDGMQDVLEQDQDVPQLEKVYQEIAAYKR
ncbi:dynamin family protein [Sutcliffiella rhizosphaerae]|uniref:GTPase Der n=1 Tax=Sutcliffiella rhizosphaerae TaxID=2880967 RepID=A0ABN8AJF9_9BACI|nr:dynamin family protein [Sutcliffiella rhizosphaerae]CAG9623692.1 GTPase Der [Sutcliffiella rhizosphaerae]